MSCLTQKAQNCNVSLGLQHTDFLTVATSSSMAQCDHQVLMQKMVDVFPFWVATVTTQPHSNSRCFCRKVVTSVWMLLNLRHAASSTCQRVLSDNRQFGRLCLQGGLKKRHSKSPFSLQANTVLQVSKPMKTTSSCTGQRVLSASRGSDASKGVRVHLTEKWRMQVENAGHNEESKVWTCEVYLIKEQPESPFSFPSKFAQTVSPLACKERDRRATVVAACSS